MKWRNLPTTEDPTSLEDALQRARELLAVIEQLNQSVQVLRESRESRATRSAHRSKAIRNNLVESRAIAIQLLRRGLAHGDHRQ